MSTQEDYTTLEEWARLPDDPDWEEDFGYDGLDLDSYTANDGRVILLPREEEMIKDDAFLIASPDSVVNMMDQL